MPSFAEETPQSMAKHPDFEMRDGIIEDTSSRRLISTGPDDQGYKPKTLPELYFPPAKTASSRSSINKSKQVCVLDSQETEVTMSEEGDSKDGPCDTRGCSQESFRSTLNQGLSAPDQVANNDCNGGDCGSNDTAEIGTTSLESKGSRAGSNEECSAKTAFENGVVDTGDDKNVVKMESRSSPSPMLETTRKTHLVIDSPGNKEVIELSDDDDDHDHDHDHDHANRSDTESETGRNELNTQVDDEGPDPRSIGRESSRSSSDEGENSVKSKPSSNQTEVIDLLGDDSGKNRDDASSTTYEDRIGDLESLVLKLTSTIKRQREDIRELEQTVADTAEESNIARKMVALRRQHKTALTTLKRTHHASMTQLRTSTSEKIDAMKAECEDKKAAMKDHYQDRMAAKEAAIQKTRTSLDVLRQQTKEKLEEAKLKAADARTQKTQNNAEIEALKKRLREEHAEEVLNCRPENNRRLQERDECIKDLKARIRELEKELVGCKADKATLRDNLQVEFETQLTLTRDRDEMGGKYRKYKSFATRLDAELKAQADRHREEKAEMVARAEKEMFQQEQKWSLQWNIAQQKSSEVVGLNRMLSELRDGQGRKDVVIRELKRKLLAGGDAVLEHREKGSSCRKVMAEQEIRGGKVDKDEAEGAEDDDERRAFGGKRKAAVLDPKDSKKTKVED